MTSRIDELAATGSGRSVTEEQTPFLAIDVEKMSTNLRRMADHAAAHGVALRPHVKTHRTPEISRFQIESGAIGICAAKISEAEVHLAAGIEDVLVAYPLTAGPRLDRAVALARERRVSFGVDSFGQARAISAAADAEDVMLELHVVVDTGLGRDGLEPELAEELAVLLDRLPGVRFGGIYTHEGHAYKAASPEELRATARAAGETMVELAGRIEAAGVGVPSVSVGSTATAEIMATIPGITEIRPGGYAFYDYGQVLLGTVEPEACAATVVATVVSGERPGRAIIDAGSNIFGAAPVSAVVSTENNDYGLLPSLPGWRVHSLSEEHGWLRWEGPGPTPMLDVGLRVEVIPVHICLAFNGAGRSVAVREGQVVARWEASARGHAW